MAKFDPKFAPAALLPPARPTPLEDDSEAAGIARATEARTKRASQEAQEGEAGSIGALWSAHRDQTIATGLNIIDHFNAEGRDRRARDEVAVRGGWSYDHTKATANLTPSQADYVAENGTTGPEALLRAQAEAQLMGQREETMAKHGFWANLAVGAGAGLADPAQWVATAGLMMPVALGRAAIGGVRGGAAGVAASLAAPRLTAGAMAAREVAFGAAQGAAFGLAEDTLGGQVKGASDYALDIGIGILVDAAPHAIRLGAERWAGIRSSVNHLTGEPGTPGSLVDELRAKGLEPPARPTDEKAAVERAIKDGQPPQPGTRSREDGILDQTDIDEVHGNTPEAPDTVPPVETIPVGETTELELEVKESPWGAPAQPPKGATEDPIESMSWKAGGGTEAANRANWPKIEEGARTADKTLGASRMFTGHEDEAVSRAKIAHGAAQANLKAGLVDPIKGQADVAAAKKALTDAEAKAKVKSEAEDLQFVRGIESAPATRGVSTSLHPSSSTRGSKGAAAKMLKDSAEVLRGLVERYMPGDTIHLVAAPKLGGDVHVRGTAWTTAKNFVIGLRDDLDITAGRTLVHEFGHVLTFRYGKLLTRNEWDSLLGAYDRFVNEPDAVARGLRRWAPGAGNQGRLQAGTAADIADPYTANFAEFAAEQFVKFMQKDPVGRGLPETLKKAFLDMVKVLHKLFMDAKQRKLLDAETAFEDFFQGILDRRFEGRTPRTAANKDMDPNALGTVEPDLQLATTPNGMDPYAQRKAVAAARGRTTDTRRQAIYDRAAAFMQGHPIMTERLRTLNARLGGGLSAGLRMAGSKNPVIQYLSSALSETTTGAAGRGNTAAVRWNMTMNKTLGRLLPTYESAWSQWANERGVGIVDRIGVSAQRAQFDNEVYSEMLRRKNRAADPATTNTAVVKAADALDAANQRAVAEAKAANIAGSANLPDGSTGYITQELDGRKIVEAGEQGREFITAKLAEHFQQVYGFKEARAARAVAEVYVTRTVNRVHGTGDVPVAAHGSDLGDIRADLINAMDGVTDPALKQAISDHAAGMKNTRRKLDVPLDDPEVRAFYNTDVLALARGYHHRMAAEVSTTLVGLGGFKGVKELRETAMRFGPPVTREEMIATDQVIAELFGQPVPGAFSSVASQNARSLVSTVRLGGMIFSQAAETMNVASHLGVASAWKFLPNLPRMVADIRGKRAGREASSGFLRGVERWGGDVGMRDYNIELPMDAPEQSLRSYTSEPSIVTSIVRHVGHASRIVNFYRGFTAAQHRYVAEELVKHVVQAHVDGKALNPYMRDMGFTDELVSRLGPAVDIVNGRIMGFDPARLADWKDAETFVQSMHRGVSQMIQGNFVGENNAWAHNDAIKILTQFRTFSITGVEKQWGRQRAVAAADGGMLDGYARVSGLLLAQLAVGSMIYALKTEVQSVGLSEKERKKKLDAAFKPAAIAAGALNMATLGGYTGDALTALMGLQGYLPGETAPRGGRGGDATESVPLVGYGAQVSATVQNPSARGLAKLLPMSNSPLVLPAINLLPAEKLNSK